MMIQLIRYSILTIGGCLLLACAHLHAQTLVDGYVFEQNNRGFLNQSKVAFYQLPNNILRGEVLTDIEGHFAVELSTGNYRIVTNKDLFFERADTIQVGTEKIYMKVEMARKPGYIFDATLAETRETPDQIIDAIIGSQVEIYNRTTQKPEMVVFDNPHAFFQFTFEQGNHYTMMIRKAGYIAKRIEAYVNVEGCIICIDGVRDINPGVTDNLTAGNKMGTLLSNIELEKAKLDKRMTIRNIYYDYDKWDIRNDAAKQLDKVVTLMRDNPGLSIELGSHTDARGKDEYNEVLSQKRAEAAIEYIISEGIDRERITAKGYGETQIINRCKNGVDCSEAEHQLNRRTELRITKIENAELEAKRWKPLEQIIREEEFDKKVKDLGKEKVIKIDEANMGSGTKNKQQPEANSGSGIKNKQQPEANTSVPMPKFEGKATEAPSTKYLLIPDLFTGYKTEILQSLEPIAEDHPIYTTFEKVYMKRDVKGLYCYFVGESKTAEDARNYFESKISKTYPKAKLVSFAKGVKSYL